VAKTSKASSTQSVASAIEASKWVSSLNKWRKNKREDDVPPRRIERCFLLPEASKTFKEIGGVFPIFL
jgi:hypothetical protein